MTPSFQHHDGTRFLRTPGRVPIPPPSAHDAERLVREAIASGKFRRIAQGESGLADKSGDDTKVDRATIEGDDQ